MTFWLSKTRVKYMETHYHDEDPFKMHVWISGAYLRLARALFQDDQFEKAHFYFQKGEEIILSDPKLVIRSQQLEILEQKLGVI